LFKDEEKKKPPLGIEKLWNAIKNQTSEEGKKVPRKKKDQVGRRILWREGRRNSEIELA